jgi:ABC-type cobalamin/Fe3+-siderophores transport system ATPase subunit
MMLKTIEYNEFENMPNAWSLKNVSFEKVNLLVGKNATGKTRAITVVSWLANMLSGIQPQLLSSGNYVAEFSDNDDIYQYFLHIEKQKIISEKLIINGEIKVERSQNGVGKIFAKQLNKDIDFQLPDNHLVVLSRRDIIQHPYLEKLFEWANGVRLYAFGSPLGKDSGFLNNDIHTLQVNLRDANQVAALFAKGTNEFPQFREQLIASMKKIGYDLSQIDFGTNQNLISPTGPIQMIYVVESGRNNPIFQPEISQGMFRALSLLIQIIYNTLKQCSTTILIDDIGEGLDFDRSSSIIKLISETAESGNAQLIMSTNDRFIMNSVPLKYWQVIQRDGGECNVFNYGNSKTVFDEFEYTGLSNFDFLSTDFLNQIFEEKDNIQ